VSDQSGYPPSVRTGTGTGPANVYPGPARAVLTHKLFASVWGVLLILGTAFLGGWSAHMLAGRYLTVESVAPMQDDIRRIGKDVDGIRSSIGVIQNDVGWVKETLHLAQQPPLVAEKSK
jgi:hypothetical protein